MKKLAILGTAALAIAVPFAVAQGASAKPSTVPQAQYPKLRSEVLKHQYVAVAPASITIERGSQERFGTGNPLRSDNVTVGPGSITIERGSQERFGSGNPLRNDPVLPETSSGSSEVDWGKVAIAMGGLFGLAAIVGTSIFGVRHRGHLGTS